MKNIWIKTIIIIVILCPISIFLHELGHWFIYEINGIDSWISLQKVNLINPQQLIDDVFLKSLFGGPVVTILIALISLLLLTKYPKSLWLFILALINGSIRILPTIIGAFKSFIKDSLSGFNDEGNIAVRISESVFLREILLFSFLISLIFIMTRIYKTFEFPKEIKKKILFSILICVLAVFISMLTPKIDFIIFGV